MNPHSALLAALAALAAHHGAAQISVNNAGDFTPADTILYSEEYRPQYHFTPAHRWIGDPCGLLRHGGEYRAYSWGAAKSADLVHWAEINRDAIKELPAATSPFTGSVVIDEANSAGRGAGVPVAVFTSFDETSKKQAQSIAFSRDGGDTFLYYDLNPVVDIWSTEFRDPTVIRHEPSGLWVMAVAKALEKKVAFYTSPDLIHWTWASDFGPMGDNERSWECPDLFQLTVEETGQKKWVLVVSVNWAREQYFTGEFNGREFIPDRPYSEPLYVDEGLDYYASRVFQNYDPAPADSAVYTLGWVNTWDYAQQAPSLWGKGVWSLPRSLSLHSMPDGTLRLRQRPAEALRQLREKPWTRTLSLRTGVTPLPAVTAMDNQYELQLTLTPKNPADVCGLNLCGGNGRKLTISYDASSGILTVDRTNTASASLPKFSRIAYAKITDGAGAPAELRIFVDKTTVEIFAADGLKVLTLLTYAPRGQNGAELFCLRGSATAAFTAWPLRSATPR